MDASAIGKVSQSWVSTKFVARWSDSACNIDREAMKAVAKTCRDKKGINVEGYDKVEKIPGSMIKDLTGVRGVMLDKDVPHPQMKRKIVQVVRGVQIFQIAQPADDSNTEESDKFCKSLTKDRNLQGGSAKGRRLP